MCANTYGKHSRAHRVHERAHAAEVPLQHLQWPKHALGGSLSRTPIPSLYHSL